RPARQHGVCAAFEWQRHRVHPREQRAVIFVDVDRVGSAEVSADPAPRGGGRGGRLRGGRIRCLDREQNQAESRSDHNCANTRSPLNFRALESHGKKITTRNSTSVPDGACDSHFALCVPVTFASSHTPCGPITICWRSNWMSG